MNNEEIILDILKSAESTSLEKALKPADLIAQCKLHGIKNEKDIEASIVSLIDQDIIDYEMDDQTNVSHIWIM